MQPVQTPPVFLDRAQVAQVLGLDDCLAAVEAAFRAHAQGRTAMPMPLHIALEAGGFHAKGACAALGREWAAVKVNSNFPGNPARGLPTIQGAALLFDAGDGRLLAILDSGELTARRTAAASALAARHLARGDARVIAICGCGAQAPAQLAAVARVRPPAQVFAWDVDTDRAREFAAQMHERLGLDVAVAAGAREAARASDIVVTVTSAREPFLAPGDVRAGTFIAAVGADHPHKSELHPGLFRGAKVVVDSVKQAATMGDLHHALDAGAISRAQVHAELADIVAGRKPGRENDSEITIFDSTGLAIQDVAAAAMAYERSLRRG